MVSEWFVNEPQEIQDLINPQLVINGGTYAGATSLDNTSSLGSSDLYSTGKTRNYKSSIIKYVSFRLYCKFLTLFGLLLRDI